jgi:hypothetical protein
VGRSLTWRTEFTSMRLQKDGSVSHDADVKAFPALEKRQSQGMVESVPCDVKGVRRIEDIAIKRHSEFIACIRRMNIRIQIL